MVAGVDPEAAERPVLESRKRRNRGMCACGHERAWHDGSEHTKACTRCSCTHYHTRRERTRPEPTGPAASLRRGELAVLRVIRQTSEVGGQVPVGRSELTVLTGYKRSSRDTYLQKLSAGRLIENCGDGFLVTRRGCEVLDSLGDYTPLPKGDELRDYWLDRLPEGESTILAVVCGRHPLPCTRDEISAATSYRRSSRDTYLQRLASRRLVHISNAGVRASPLLFGAM